VSSPVLSGDKQCGNSAFIGLSRFQESIDYTICKTLATRSTGELPIIEASRIDRK